MGSNSRLRGGDVGSEPPCVVGRERVSYREV